MVPTGLSRPGPPTSRESPWLVGSNCCNSVLPTERGCDSQICKTENEKRKDAQMRPWQGWELSKNLQTP